MTKYKKKITLQGRIIAAYIDVGVEEMVCLRLRSGDGAYPYVMYRDVYYTQFQEIHIGRKICSVQELTLEELCTPEHESLFASFCADLGDQDSNNVCERLRKFGGSMFLHLMEDGGEIVVWSKPPVIRYNQPKQIYYWDVGMTYDKAYGRRGFSNLPEVWHPWRTDSFLLQPHGADDRLYGDVQILDACTTDFALRISVEDELKRIHRVAYRNYTWYDGTDSLVGLTLTRVRETDLDELTNGKHEIVLERYIKVHPHWRTEITSEVEDYGYKLYLHETGNPETEFLVIAEHVYMT